MWWRRKTSDDSSGYPVDWNRRRAKIFRRDKWTCQSCGRTGGPRGTAELHAHHVVPKSHGGGHELDNLTTVCDRCHAEVHGDKRLLADRDPQPTAWKNHALVAGLTGWWTFGIGNLLYEGYRRKKASQSNQHQKERRDGVRRLQKEARNRKRTRSAESKGARHKEVEAGYNAEFGGCQSCGRKSLTVRWEKRGARRKKIIECEHCNTLYQERVVGGDLQLQPIKDESQINSERSGLVYELEKHLELGTIDESELKDIQKKLLQEVDTEEEKQHIRSTFRNYVK